MLPIPIACAVLAHADPTDLRDGVFIAHYSPAWDGYSIGSQWPLCDGYYVGGDSISHHSQQLNWIEDPRFYKTWYVLAAWNEEKEWNWVELGLGEFDPIMLRFDEVRGCFPDEGLVFETNGWPGPNEGVIVHAIGESWQGSYVPVLACNCYVYAYYYGPTIIPLSPHPTTGRAGTGDDQIPPEFWEATCLGGMGLGMEGIYCEPLDSVPHVCCIDEGCSLLSEEECDLADGEFHSGWNSCEPNRCQPPLSACCIGESCSDLSWEACNAAGGDWHPGRIACEPGMCAGQVLRVEPDGSGDHPTIQAAIDAAGSWDIIELSEGIFTGDGNRDLDFQAKTITIRSHSGDPSTCIIDCDGTQADPHHGFLFEQGERSGCMLAGVTISGAYPSGIYCHNALPTLHRCALVNNAGCGLYMENTLFGYEMVTIRDCAFIGNLDHGVEYRGYHPTFENCVFTDNTTADDGAGILLYFCHVARFMNCRFSGNVAGTKGGAIASDFYSEPLLDITGCTFAGNSAGTGGGAINVSYGECRLRGCTLHASEATYGSGLRVDALQMENSIIAFGLLGSAVFGSGPRSIACSDIYGNQGGDWVEAIAGLYGQDGNISEDPLFCDPGNLDFRLMEDSPCAPFTPPNSECDLIGAWPAGCQGQSIDGQNELCQIAHGDLRIHPSLVSEATTLLYSLPRPGRARLTIHDPTGRLVRVLLDAPLEAGWHQLAWDGSSDDRRRLESGVYFARLAVGGVQVIRRTVIVR